MAEGMVTVEAAYSKRKRRDTQVLHPAVVERLVRWLATKKPKPGKILFPISKRTCGVDRKASKMMWRDLEVARVQWIKEAKTEKERGVYN